MRARSIRLSILILLLLGLALLALGFRDISIDIPGFPELNRGGSGPLGLKLGLDLRGGGHLVYQADTGTRFDVNFEEPKTADEVTGALEGLRFGEPGLAFEEFSVRSRGVTAVQIKTALMDPGDPRRAEFQETMSAELGVIESLEISDIQDPTSDDMEGVLHIINRRVNLFGTEEPIIQQFGDDRIIVQLPGAGGSITEVRFASSVEDEDAVPTLERLLVDAGFDDLDVERQDHRSFRIKSATVSTTKRDVAREALEARWGTIDLLRVTSGIDEAKKLIGDTARLEFKERTCADPSCLTFTDADLGLSGDELSRAYPRTDPAGIGWVVVLNFNDDGSEIFSDLTRRIVGQDTKRIAIFLDDEPIKDSDGRDLALHARAWIRDGRTEISGNFTREYARTFAIQLEAGRLPVPLKLIQENDVDALLGSESLRNSLIAGLVGLGLVIVFMVVYYRMAGVVAAVALVFYAIVVLAVFKLIPITLTLSHIGGFILSIGMAVDANILIFERMKEEVRIGRTLASSMEVGFNRAWPAIRDGNVSTLFTCGVLLWFGDRLGGGLVTGFAISLGIGVLASMFTAVVLSRNLLQLMAWIGLGHRIGLFTPEGARRPAQTAGGGR